MFLNKDNVTGLLGNLVKKWGSAPRAHQGTLWPLLNLGVTSYQPTHVPGLPPGGSPSSEALAASRGPRRTLKASLC